MDGKENVAVEEAPSLSVASPRISSVGAPSEEGGRAGERPHMAYQAYTDSLGHDHIHWGGLGQRAGDARSVASSAAADRDDKSLYEDPGVLDATEEGEEHDEDDDDEEPEEITLTQVQGELRDMPQLRTEPSAAESNFTAISGAGSLAAVVDQLADQAVAGELSPRQAAAAIRSATARGAVGGAAAGAGASAATDVAEHGSDSVSLAGVAHSSIAPSEEGWQGGGLGGGSTAELGLMESVPLEAEAPPAEAEAPPAEPAQPASPPAEAADEGSAAAEEPLGAGAEAPPPAAPEEQAEEAAAAAEEPASAAEAASAGAEEVQAPAAEEEAEQAAAAAAEPQLEPQEPAPAPEAAEAGEAAKGAGTAAADAAAGGDGEAAAAAPGGVPRTASAGYQSRLMQQLTASASEEDITVYSAADADPLAAGAAAREQQQQQAAAGPVAAAAAAAAAPASGGMQALSIANGGGSKGGVAPMSAADTAKTMAAINAASGHAQPGQPEAAVQQGTLPFAPAWYQQFKGLLYMDGVDALGRPVVVINADVVPSNMKASALLFVKQHVEPLVNQGEYVLVFTSPQAGTARLPSMWIMGAYRSLPRPFRKHVQHIVLVRPSAFLRAVLAFMRPFVSRKAHRKIKLVGSVHDVAAATEGEVTLQSLGPAFLAEHLAAEEAAAAAAAAAGGGGGAGAGSGSGGASP